MAINFPTSLDGFSAKTDNVDDVMAADVNDLQDAVEALQAKVGIDSSAVTTSLDYKVNNFFATGRKVYLYENTAPTGWSIVSVTDRVLAVKGGSNAYNVNGGNTAGTWTQPNHIHPGLNHTHTMSSHTHDLGTGASGSSYDTGGTVCHDGSGGLANYLGGGSLTRSKATPTTGGPSTANTGANSNGDNTGNGATAATWRPAAAVGIIVQKS